MQLKRSKLTSRYRRQQQRSLLFLLYLYTDWRLISECINFTSVLYRVSLCMQITVGLYVSNFSLSVRLSVTFVHCVKKAYCLRQGWRWFSLYL